ncbi:MAG: hypothetical protein NTW32_15345 [Chloroflexi bacterium]|nr:hypothetical protein [Chloroflexota bacterium]
MKISKLDIVNLLLTGLLAAYQVMIGINGLGNMPIIAYTVAFGVLLVAGLLIIILGFEVLDSPVVVIVSTIIPLSLSLGLVWEHLENWRSLYLGFVLAGFLAILLTRSFSMPGKLPTIILAFIHGIAGLVIFLLPSVLAANGTMKPGFALVGLGGALIGIGGLLLSFLKAGKPIVKKETILRVLPGLLLLMTAAFVAGFALG